MFLFISLLHHISFSCSFYTFSKYCYYPSIVPKNECQSVIKRRFILRIQWKKSPAKDAERAMGSGYLCLLRDRFKYSQRHRDLKKWKEQREGQGKAIKVSVD